MLYAFSLAKAKPDAELLDEYVHRYPNHATALTDLAIEMIFEAARADVDQATELARLTVTPTVSRVMSRFQNRLFGNVGSGASSREEAPFAGVSSPFASLDRQAFRNIANGLRANSVFVAKLRDCEIDPTTMSADFRKRVADEVKVPLDLLTAHFASPAQTHIGQYYKANGKPAAVPKQSFQDAVRTSGLTEEQQQYLLSL